MRFFFVRRCPQRIFPLDLAVSLLPTIEYMKLLMDADCLIKLTKAGLKELIAGDAAISIPETVRREVVDAG